MFADGWGHIAATRFGLGAAPGELAQAGADPKGWLLAQTGTAPLPAELAALPDSAGNFARFLQIREDRRERRLDPQAPDPDKGAIRALYLADAAARIRAAVASRQPFAERLAEFWSNHFTVSITRPIVAPLAGAFEREAIRPHLFGRFHQMLAAVIAHPAMLLYLDNARSLGPESPAGLRRDKGLNENLARELMELHTLGVDGGYSQDDVGALARILTGWTVGNGRNAPAGRFLFEPRFHEPGPKRLLGVLYPEEGRAEGERALLDLARRPATARFVATKLARHFIADDPPPAAVAALAETFRATDGDLMAMSRSLVGLPEAWTTPLAKVKSPNDFVISILRGLALPLPEDRRLVGAMGFLGQAPWAAPSPAGWPDRAESWMGPEALMRRIEWLKIFTARLGRISAAEILDRTLGPLASGRTRQAVAAAAAGEGLMLLLASPEFQRR